MSIKAHAAVGPSDALLERLARRAGRQLLLAKRSAVSAESCTGGWIAKSITDIEGSSQWFAAGFVTYSNAAKQRTLGVSATLLRRHGAVSEAVARAMAVGALGAAEADLAVAVTGIAGPGGAVPGKPVGTVWFAWAVRRGRGREVHAVVKRFRGDREAVRRKSVHTALAGILRLAGAP